MALYEPKAYQEVDEDRIRFDMGKRGYDPKRVEEPAGTEYDAHKNPTDLLLVFLQGSSDVRVGNETFHCTAGDRLQIPGSVEHSAKVGQDGVVYLLTEIELIGD